MSKIRIVTDTTASLPLEYAAAHAAGFAAPSARRTWQTVPMGKTGRVFTQ